MNNYGNFVLVEPGKEAKIISMELSLDNMQKVVGGLIQTVYPWKSGEVLVCNDNGMILGLPMNRALFRFDNPEDLGPGYEFDIYDIVFGTFFVCAQSGGELVGLTDDQSGHFKERFLNPERFVYLNRKLFSLPKNAVDLANELMH